MKGTAGPTLPVVHWMTRKGRAASYDMRLIEGPSPETNETRTCSPFPPDAAHLGARMDTQMGRGILEKLPGRTSRPWATDCGGADRPPCPLPGQRRDPVAGRAGAGRDGGGSGRGRAHRSRHHRGVGRGGSSPPRPRARAGARDRDQHPLPEPGVHLLAYLPDPTTRPCVAELRRILDGPGRPGPDDARPAARPRDRGRDRGGTGRDHRQRRRDRPPDVADLLVRLGVVADRDQAFEEYCRRAGPPTSTGTPPTWSACRNRHRGRWGAGRRPPVGTGKRGGARRSGVRRTRGGRVVRHRGRPPRPRRRPAGAAASDRRAARAGGHRLQRPPRHRQGRPPPRGRDDRAGPTGAILARAAELGSPTNWWR